jgi:hypothetical protein
MASSMPSRRVEAASTPEAPSDRIARAVKGPFRNSADFAKELADFEFPLSPAFLYTVHDIDWTRVLFISTKCSRNSCASREICETSERCFQGRILYAGLTIVAYCSHAG